MIIPLRTDCPLRRVPWMNWAIIALNVAVFLADNVFSLLHRHGQPAKQWLALNPQDPALWQYFTYQFLHENWLHIVGNMLFLYIFGNNINDRLGQWGYLAFYLAGGVLAGVGYALWNPFPLIGASGAVAAVTGAYLILLPRSRVTVFIALFIVTALDIPSLWFVLFWFVQDVIGLFHPGAVGDQSAVGHMAHVSGTAFGVVVSLGLLACGLLPRDPFDVISLVARWQRKWHYGRLVRQGYDPFGVTPTATLSIDPPLPRSGADQGRIGELRAQINQAIGERQVPRAAELFMELKKLDPTQFLSRRAQLDVANQLASRQAYPDAASCYEQFLQHYPTFEQIEQVELMLGVIYARYLRQYQRAGELLLGALARLQGQREIDWAKSELARIQPFLSPRPGS